MRRLSNSVERFGRFRRIMAFVSGFVVWLTGVGFGLLSRCRSTIVLLILLALIRLSRVIRSVVRRRTRRSGLVLDVLSIRKFSLTRRVLQLPPLFVMAFRDVKRFWIVTWGYRS